MPPRLELDECHPDNGVFQTVTGLQDIDRAERAMAIGLAMNVLSREDRELFWFAESAEEVWRSILAWHERRGTPLITPCPPLP